MAVVESLLAAALQPQDQRYEQFNARLPVEGRLFAGCIGGRVWHRHGPHTLTRVGDPAIAFHAGHRRYDVAIRVGCHLERLTLSVSEDHVVVAHPYAELARVSQLPPHGAELRYDQIGRACLELLHIDKRHQRPAFPEGGTGDSTA
jgi:hypothetical protein